MYLPDWKSNTSPTLEAGKFWHRQGHVFESPFYYIDYVLAQFCAFQFWLKAEEDREKAWADYVNLCKAGGTQSFLNLLKIADLDSPFEPGTISKVVKAISGHLDKLDDSKM